MKLKFKKSKKSTSNSNDDKMTVSQLLDYLNVKGVNKKALNEATYFACLKVLSESMGKLPLHLMEYTDEGGAVRHRGDIDYILGSRPNPFMTATTFISTIEYNRNHYGNAYVYIDETLSYTRLWPLPSREVKIWYDDAKKINEIPDVYYEYKGKMLASCEVLHLKSSNTFNGIVGVPVRQQLLETVIGNKKAQKMLNDMYDSGFTAKAILNYTGSLNDENEEAFTRKIEEMATGKYRKRGIKNFIPMPVGTSVTPLTVKLSDNQFIESKQYSALQIASAFGIKPYQIGDYTKSSYASEEAQQLSFYIDTLLYIVKQYEEELTFKLLTEQQKKQGLHFKFNINVILRANAKEQAEVLTSYHNGGLITANEAREKLELPRDENGNKLIVNGTYVPLEFVGKQYQTIANSNDDKIKRKEDDYA